MIINKHIINNTTQLREETMKRIITLILTLTFVTTLTGCILNNTDANCNTDISSDVDTTGVLYKTQCVKDNVTYYGLINSNLEQVIPEIYTFIDTGIEYYESIENKVLYDEEVEYFRVRYVEDSNFLYGIINRDGDKIFELVHYADLIISQNQESFYLYESSGQIYNIEEETYESVDYRIINRKSNYYIASRGENKIVLDSSFSLLYDDHYDDIFVIDDEVFLYEKDQVIYRQNRVTNERTELFSIIEYSFHVLLKEWNEYFLINPNSNVSFIDSVTGEHTVIEGCSRILDIHEDTFMMFCQENHQVFSKDTLTLEYAFSKTNTEIVNRYPVYFNYGDYETTIHSIGKTITFDSKYESHEVLPGGLLQVYTEGSMVFIDLKTFEELFKTNITCKVSPNTYNSELFGYEGDCTINDTKPTVELIYLGSTRLDIENLEIIYYTDELIIFLNDGETVITDWELNILYE